MAFSFCPKCGRQSLTRVAKPSSFACYECLGVFVVEAPEDQSAYLFDLQEPSLLMLVDAKGGGAEWVERNPAKGGAA